MKTAPIFMTKQMMVNRLTDRNNRIATHYVKIADNLPKQSGEFLKEARLSLAKYARRHNCRLSFVNGKNGTTMNIERQLASAGKNSEMNVKPTGYVKEGEVALPKSLNDTIAFIRNGIKSVMGSVNR